MIRCQKLFNFNILFAVHIKPTKYCRFTFAFADYCDVAATDMRQRSGISPSNTHHCMLTLSNFNFDRMLPCAFVSFRKNHGQVHRLMYGWAPFRHTNDVLLQHVLPILLKERVAAAHRGQRFQIQKWVQDLMNPDIVGHLIDPAGRRQQGSTGKRRSEGHNRDFLAFGRWRSG
jgi:hypothetical protein